MQNIREALEIINTQQQGGEIVLKPRILAISCPIEVFQRRVIQMLPNRGRGSHRKLQLNNIRRQKQ